MSYLFIVEAPGKIKKIQSYLGNDYIVRASCGHIMDLPKKSIGIDEDTFTPSYEITNEKSVNELMQQTKRVDSVLLASDVDREGEFIAWSLVYALNIKKYARVKFHEITKSALEKSIKNLTIIDDNLVSAQQARRIIDRLIGYKLSPLMWKLFNNINLSIGRVQTVTVKLVLDKENNINNELQNLQTYYTIKGTFINEKGTLKDCKLILGNGSTYKLDINDKSEQPRELTKIFNILHDSEYSISDIKDKIVQSSPQPPYITTTLQQDANKILKFSIDKTMKVAQKLYEAGHITYMRTDSTDLSQVAVNMIKNYIESNYGLNYYQYRTYKNNKFSQEAHEAIRPTHVEQETIETQQDELALYKLIWNRTIASLMSNAKYSEQDITIIPKILLEHKFLHKTKQLIFDGYLRLLQGTQDDEQIQKVFVIGDKLKYKMITAAQEHTDISQRYTDASLVKKMETLGIGRPSTYSSIINKISERKYVEKKSCNGQEIILNTFEMNKNGIVTCKKRNSQIGKDTNKIFATNIGKDIVMYMETTFPKLVDYNLTALIENDLDNIASGKILWVNVVKMVYEIFNPILIDINKKFAPKNTILKELKKGKKCYKIMDGQYGTYIRTKTKNIKYKIDDIKAITFELIDKYIKNKNSKITNK